MKQKKILSALVLFVFATVMGRGALPVYAATSGSVVINEVAWAGSADSSTDEWLELYNNSDQEVDLKDWIVNDDHGASLYKIMSGSIQPHSYFLIEDHETTVTTVTSDAIIHLSLANSGDSLQLYDPIGQLMDTVNGSGAMWFSGDATTKATMERRDPLASGDFPSNWVTSIGSGEKSSGGSDIIGTPRKVNSPGNGNPSPVSTATVDVLLSSSTPVVGDVLTATVKVANAKNLFAYGFDLSYDPALLHFKAASVKGFLSEDSKVVTSFQSAMENGIEGKLVLAEARTAASKTGVSGDGDLLALQFEVIQASGVSSKLDFTDNSFLASPSGDNGSNFVDSTFTVQPKSLDAVTNLVINAGTERYSLDLHWDAVNGATAYRILRQNPHDEWIILHESAALNFLDKDGVKGGGNLVPDHEYHYRVVAVDAKRESLPAEASKKDSRGLRGDNNRSDRIDGRDLEKLARHFGELDSEQSFDVLSDTTYDGRIDGSDLIDIGANFARTFTL